MKIAPMTAMRRCRLARVGVSLLLMASLLAAPGCGGGGTRNATGTGVSLPSKTRGQVRFAIKWPEKATATRLIPRAAESIKFRCLDADDEDEVILETVVPRGQSVATLDLPSVRVRIEAEARSGADGGGQVLAKGGVTVVVKEALVAAEKLTMDSVIAQVTLSQTDISVSGTESAEVRADARDSEGAIVLTAAENWEWTPEDGAADIVSYQSTGNTLTLQAKQDGAAAFTVRETESGKTARVTVTSHADTSDPGSGNGQPGYVVEPSTANLSAGDLLNLQAYWQDESGNRTPKGAIFYGDYRDFYRIYQRSDGTRPFLALREGETTMSVLIEDTTIEVPVKISGHLLAVTVFPGENGEEGEVEIYVDADMVLKTGTKGNAVGALVGDKDHTTAIPLPIQLAPGRHYIYAKGVSDKPVRFHADIIGVADLSGTVEKDNYVTDVFYKP